MSSSQRTPNVSSQNPFFVGREAELARFRDLLTDDTGRAVVILGQQGFGKTSLAHECLAQAEAHPNTCHSLWYEVIRKDSADAIMERMLEEVFAGAGVEGSLAASERRKAQWKALVEVLPKGKEIVSLFQALKAQPSKPVRERLVIALTQISADLEANQRLLLVMDPEKYLAPSSAEAWTAFVRRLPSKVLLLIPQRPDDALARHADFLRQGNVVLLPEHSLPELGDEAVQQLQQAKLPNSPHSEADVLEALRRYEGHPFAVTAALDLLADERPGKKRIAPADLPRDPKRLAAEQWERILNDSADLAKVFEAHAVLEVPVPMEIVSAVAQVEPATYRRVLAHPYLGGLLSQHEDGHRRIYHSLLSEYVLDLLSEKEIATYHERARDVYRERLETSTPKDRLAALRLPEHVLAAEGKAAFAEVVGLEVAEVLYHLGFREEALALLQRARQWAESGSQAELAAVNYQGWIFWQRGELKEAEARFREVLELADEEDLKWQAKASGNLGLIYKARGDLAGAEQLHRKALEIYEELGNREGIARHFGNLGTIYWDRGDLDGAEQLYRKALEIDKQLGNREGIARHSGNLGLIYQVRGDLDGAEELFRQALEIAESLGLAEDTAHSYTNLGNLYHARGDLETAREWWQKALLLYEKLGSPWAERVKDWLARYGA